LKRVLTAALKQKKKFLTCEKCEATRRSVDGFISHMQFCGKSEEVSRKNFVFIILYILYIFIILYYIIYIILFIILYYIIYIIYMQICDTFLLKVFTYFIIIGKASVNGDMSYLLRKYDAFLCGST